MNLFAGLSRAYGTFKVDPNEIREDGKIGGKATTIKGSIKEAFWSKHISGTKSLGIVPINDDDCCKFGAIDIDEYDLNYDKVLDSLTKIDITLVPCLTKSGGLHLYLFLDDWIPAKIVQNKLKELAATIGFGTSEIFPKQTKILTERGDVGSWISLPYFGDSRKMIIKDIGPVTLSEFLLFAEKNKFSLKKLQGSKPYKTSDLKDGPPCLQILVDQKFPLGSRNVGLFNLGVYLRKSHPDTWRKDVEAYNRKYMDPPLDMEEVKIIIKSLSSKKYEYGCSKEPISFHCNIGVCKNRKYGIDDTSKMQTLHSLTKVNTTPPIWFIDIDGGGRIELSTEDLQNQRRFQKRCLETINLLPKKMSDNSWHQLLQDLLENLIVIDMPIDASARGQLMYMIEKFCTGKSQARNREEILLGKPWYNNEDRRHYFRMSDLLSYLDRHRFKDFKTHEIALFIKNNNGESKFFNIKGKGINIWSLNFYPGENE